MNDKDGEDHALDVMSYNMRNYYEQPLLLSMQASITFRQLRIETGEIMDYVPGRLERLLMKTGWRSRKYKESKARRNQRRREYMKSHSGTITFRRFEPVKGDKDEYTTIPTDSHRNGSRRNMGNDTNIGDDPVERNEQMKTEEDYIAEELKAEHEEEERKISELEEERTVFGVKL